jgi:hypothetical protein
MKSLDEALVDAMHDIAADERLFREQKCYTCERRVRNIDLKCFIRPGQSIYLHYVCFQAIKADYRRAERKKHLEDFLPAMRAMRGAK